MRELFWNEYVQSPSSSWCINVCTEVIDPSSSRRIWAWTLYTSRALIIGFTKDGSETETLAELTFAESGFVELKFTVLERRTVDIILTGVVWTVNYRRISLLIFRVIAIRRKTECASAMLEAWLCSPFLTSKIHEPLFWSFSLAIIKKGHSMCLLPSWRRFVLYIKQTEWE